MTDYMARWMRLKRYTRPQIDKIHAIERRAAELYRTKRIGYGGVPLGASAAFMNDLDLHLGPIWPREISVEHRTREIEIFQKRAWRLAADIVSDQEKGELEALHEADWIVYGQVNGFDRSSSSSTSKNPELERLKAGAQKSLPAPTGKEAAAGPESYQPDFA